MILEKEEHFDLDGVQNKLRVSRELPIIDESRMRGINVNEINAFLEKLSYIVFGERTYGIELDGFLSIYPLREDKDFGVRIRQLPDKIPADFFPTVLIIDHVTCAKRDERDKCLEETVALYSVFPSENGKQPLFKALRLHYKPAPKELSELFGSNNGNGNNHIDPTPMFKSERLA